MIKTNLCYVNTIEQFLQKRREGYGIPYIRMENDLKIKLFDYFKLRKDDGDEELLCYAVFAYRYYAIVDKEENESFSSTPSPKYNYVLGHFSEAIKILHSLYAKGNLEACSYLAWYWFDYGPFDHRNGYYLTRNLDYAMFYANDCINKGYAYGWGIRAYIESQNITDGEQKSAISYTKGIENGCDICAERAWLCVPTNTHNWSYCLSNDFDAFDAPDMDKYFALLKGANDRVDDPYNQAMLGEMYYEGIGTICDYEKAYSLCQKDVWMDSFLDSDYVVNNNGLTILAYFGLHFLYPEKYNNPIGIMKKFSTNPLAQMEYCLRLENYEEYAKCAIKAYNNKRDFPDYQYEKIDVAMGRCYLAGWGVARDTERAKKLLCQYPSGKAYLADAHYNGWCVPYDLAEAYRLCKESEGEYLSKYVLANMYLHGFYVKQDEEKGIQYLIDGGYNYKYGANLLAYYYHVGAIVDKDEMQAIRYYTCALNDGNGGAGNNMGLIYEYSPKYKNYQKAFNCYYRSAHCKDSGGAISLGRCYENGIGCPVDKGKALEIYKIAKRWGNGEAQKFIDNLNSQGIY